MARQPPTKESVMAELRNSIAEKESSKIFICSTMHYVYFRMLVLKKARMTISPQLSPRERQQQDAKINQVAAWAEEVSPLNALVVRSVDSQAAHVRDPLADWVEIERILDHLGSIRTSVWVAAGNAMVNASCVQDEGQNQDADIQALLSELNLNEFERYSLSRNFGGEV
jgi:hypothetical protein